MVLAGDHSLLYEFEVHHVVASKLAIDVWFPLSNFSEGMNRLAEYSFPAYLSLCTESVQVE